MAPHMRKVEQDILIPRYLEYKINHELCRDEMKNFADCAREAGLLVTFRCRDIYNVYVECANKWWRDEATRKEVEDDYLMKRAYYRKHGVPYEKSPFSRFGTSKPKTD